MRILLDEIVEVVKNLRKSFYRLPTPPNRVKPRAKRCGKVKYLVRDGKEVKNDEREVSL